VIIGSGRVLNIQSAHSTTLLYEGEKLLCGGIHSFGFVTLNVVGVRAWTSEYVDRNFARLNLFT